MIVAGLDPGKGGALVILYEDGSTSVLRVPLVARPGKTSKGPDWPTWALRWRGALEFGQPDVFVMEDVHGWKGQAAGASFAFGKAAGFALALILAAGVPVHYAPPNVWKTRLKVRQDKSHAIEEAGRLIPSLTPAMRFKKDDGVAEAGLLAYYGRMTISAK